MLELENKVIRSLSEEKSPAFDQRRLQHEKCSIAITGRDLEYNQEDQENALPVEAPVVPAAELEWRADNERVAASNLEWKAGRSAHEDRSGILFTRALYGQRMSSSGAENKRNGDASPHTARLESLHTQRENERFRRQIARLSSNSSLASLLGTVRASVPRMSPSLPWSLGPTNAQLGPHQPLSLSQKKAPEHKFFIDTFVWKLTNRLWDEHPGAAYSFIVTQNGQSYAEVSKGDARRVSSPHVPALQMTADQPVNIASVSKVITAAAVLKAMELFPGHSLDEQIWTYFPRRWTASHLFKPLTFEHCLQYRIGTISQENGGVGSGYEAIREFYHWGGRVNGGYQMPGILQPWQFGDWTFETYNNICFAWLRYVIFYMTAPAEIIDEVETWAEYFATHEGNVDPDFYINWVVGEYYVSFVRETLLVPIGIKFADTRHVSPYYFAHPVELQQAFQTLYYKFPVKIQNGSVGWDWTDKSAGGGWVLSARDLARFWVHLRYGLLLNPGNTNKIFRFDEPKNSFATGFFESSRGVYFHKGGLATEDNGGYSSFVFDSPVGVQLAIVMNHDGSSDTMKNKVIISAYADSYL